MSGRFSARTGFEVLAIEGLGIGESLEDFRYLARVPPEVVYRLARRVDRPDADAILISCTDLATPAGAAAARGGLRQAGRDLEPGDPSGRPCAAGGIKDRIEDVARLLSEH
ncbi:MAG: hypothetical protein WDO24_27495 [Pseudomonadota bacterium]